MVKGLKKTSRRLPRFLRNAIRADRFWKYGWGVYGLWYATRTDFGVRRSNRVYNFCVNYPKTGRLFDSRGV